MRRPVIIALTVLAFFLIAPTQVSAQSFTGAVRFEAIAGDNGVLDIEQEIDLINTSDQFLISSYTQQFPFSIDSLTAYLNGIPLNVLQEGNKATVQFGSNSVKLNERKVLTLKYSSSDALVVTDVLKEVSWPVFEFTFPLDDYSVRLYYPEAWGEPSYAISDFAPAPGRFGYKGISLNAAQPAYLIIGEQKPLDFTAKFGLTHGRDAMQLLRVGLPDERLGEFRLGEITGAERGVVNKHEQHFLVAEVGQRQRVDGTFAGVWIPYDEPGYPESLELGEQGADIDFLKLREDYDYNDLWQDLQRRLTPADSYLLTSRQSIEDTITSREHNPLDYAHVYASAYRSLGYPANVVFGIAKFPNAQGYIWHSWVAVKTDKGWLQQDPYLQDLFSYPYSTRISQFHIPWMILDEDTDPATCGVTTIDPATIVSYTDSPSEFEYLFDPVAALEVTGASYSGRPLPLEIRVRNNGTAPLRISAVIIEGVSVPDEIFKEQWLIPGAEAVVPVNGVLIDDPFFSGNKTISGAIELYSDDETVSLPLAISVNLVVDYRTLAINLTVVMLLIIALSIGFKNGVFNVPLFRRKA